jgi:hypothetical protein
LASRASREVAVGAGASALAIGILGLAILGAAGSSTIEALPLRTLLIALIDSISLVLIWRLGLTESDRAVVSSMARRRSA